ncbi:recombinase family protein [Rhodococcus sp. JG-3]|uniref:recombinase family protein n=1 Tax=Rhodococcus sp. JG-3 TaxID=1305835 RepID=UPI0004235195|nr:recombinase family protein [Rhodococcus sp. JG-3]
MTSNAAIYCRISKARRNDEDDTETLGVERQERLCRELAVSLGLDVAAVFVDNDLSGKAGVLRPAYEQLKQAVADRSIDVVLVWKTDRLSRDRIALQLFYELLRTNKVKLHTQQEGLVTLDTPDGALMAGIRAELAQYERGVIAERVRAQKTQAAQAGRVLGGRYRLYGYQDKQRTTVDPVERKHLLQIVEWYLAGRTIHSITRTLNDDGVRSISGKPWLTQQVRRILANPAYAGLREFNGEIVAEGKWPKIIDRDTHERIMRKLNLTRGQTNRNVRRYLLTGILYCGICHTKMTGGNNGRDSYRCSTTNGGCGRVSRNAAKVDWALIELTAMQIRKLPFEHEQKHVDRSELDQVEHDIELLADARKSGRIDMVTFLDQNEALQRQKTKLVVEMDSATTLITLSGRDREFRASPTDEKRETIRRFFPAVGIKPVTKGVRFSLDQLELPKPLKTYLSTDYDSSDTATKS